MGKHDRDRVNTQSQDLHNQFTQQQNNINNQLGANSALYGQRGQAGYDQLQGNYTDIYNKALAGGYGGPTSYYSNFAENGGWDPSAVAGQNADIGALEDYARNPISDEDKAKWLGSGVYDDLAKTGGLSMTDRAMMRQRGDSVNNSIASGLKSDLENQSAITGRPVSAAAESSAARGLAQQAGTNAVNTELGITNAVNQGRLQGAQGLTSSESSLNDFIKGAKLGGYGAAGGLRQGMQSSMQQGKEFGIAGLSDANKQNIQMQMYAVAGRAGLQKQDTDMYMQTMNQLMQSQGLSAQEANSYISQQMALNPASSFWKKVGGAAKIIGGAAITYFSGGALAPVGIGLAGSGIDDLTGGGGSGQIPTANFNTGGSSDYNPVSPTGGPGLPPNVDSEGYYQ